MAMGSPIGLQLDDVMMAHVIDKEIEIAPLGHQPKFSWLLAEGSDFRQFFAAFTNTSSIDIQGVSKVSIHFKI